MIERLKFTGKPGEKIIDAASGKCIGIFNDSGIAYSDEIALAAAHDVIERLKTLYYHKHPYNFKVINMYDGSPINNCIFNVYAISGEGERTLIDSYEAPEDDNEVTLYLYDGLFYVECKTQDGLHSDFISYEFEYSPNDQNSREIDMLIMPPEDPEGDGDGDGDGDQENDPDGGAEEE